MGISQQADSLQPKDLNLNASIFPSTTFGGLLNYSQANWDLMAGVYNLNYEFYNEESFHFDNHFFQKGYLAVGEVHYLWWNANRLLVEFRVGGYLKNCSEPQDNPEITQGHMNYGLYFIGDVTAYEGPSGDQLGVFIQLGLAPEKTNLASQYVRVSPSEVNQNHSVRSKWGWPLAGFD